MFGWLHYDEHALCHGWRPGILRQEAASHANERFRSYRGSIINPLAANDDL